MTLPSTLKNKKEWTFIGPMGPSIPDFLESYPTIAVDGGANFSETYDVWIGDSDSLKKEIKCEHVHKYSNEKEQSDLALALGLFPILANYRFHFWGFLGGRGDHEIFNIGEALTFLEKSPQSEIIFYDQSSGVRFRLVGKGFWNFTHFGLFSLGALNATQIKLSGACKYQLPVFSPLLPLSSFGLSNVAQGELTLETLGPVFIYFPKEAL